jgi:hypothetical protein
LKPIRYQYLIVTKKLTPGNFSNQAEAIKEAMWFLRAGKLQNATVEASLHPKTIITADKSK